MTEEHRDIPSPDANFQARQDRSLQVSGFRVRLKAEMPYIRQALKTMVGVQSVSMDPARDADVYRSAQMVADLFRAEGFHDSKIVSAYEDGRAPAVIARIGAPEGRPTVLLYAHHDVQPASGIGWLSEPFEPVERDGRLFGRGAADNKAGIAAHLAAVRTLGTDLGVGVTVFVEGEEEAGSASLPALLRQHTEALRADVIVIADSANWDIGTPALTTSMRGLIRADVSVRTLSHSVHAGVWGGLVPDALMTLVRLLATLYDEQGNVAIAGLRAGRAADVEYPSERLRAESGIVAGVSLIGDGSAVQRLWSKPSLTIIGMDAPEVQGAGSVLVPSARAKLSMRIAPGDTAANALDRLRAHLQAHVPWNAELSITNVEMCEPVSIEARGEVYEAARRALADAWGGTPPVDIGLGGSIPIATTFLQIFPDADVLITGVEDPDTRAHGANESLHLAEFENYCLAETLLLTYLSRLGS
ncbi:dipeptidase [Mycobacterium sp. 852013-50091_SCH5140682]|uniref:dipeptidase n=1 Tax=Mycobacterium sp. 852013-50091_SCH5140682 TaxID=1834109 RepID=UPI000A7CBABF|nr:dipeptidase [Mycobacterium sp. 852013-50091_SCH5140682]